MRIRAFLSLALVAASPLALSGQNMLRDTERACERGELSSCTVLGLIYETGAAGARNLPRAIELYQRSCSSGLPEACTRLALAQAGPIDTASVAGIVRRGYIADAETGAPIGEAVIEVPRFGIRLVADEAGRVQVGPLPRGSYDITAGRFGYVRVDGVLPFPYETDFVLLMERAVFEETETLGRIVGRVVDEATGQGMPNVDVVLAGSEQQRVVTGPDGRFALAGLAPGRAEVAFSHLGYGTRTTSVLVEAGEVLEIRASLTMQPIELEPIEVRVGSQYLERSGFYRRSSLVMGTQFNRRDLDLIDPLGMSDIIQRVPGVTTVAERGRTRVIGTRSSNRLQQPDGCRLRLYLDGVAMHDWDLDFVRPGDLEAVEVYHGANTPVEYQHLIDPDGVYPCGVVLIWTRRNN
jgi:hypothetical protein